MNNVGWFCSATNLVTNVRRLECLTAHDTSALLAARLLIRGPHSVFCVHLLQGYYKRTPAYMPIRKRERRGCFAVPMVHSTYLVDLQKEASRELAFYPPHPEYSWALDDVIIFAYSARMAGETEFCFSSGRRDVFLRKT